MHWEQVMHKDANGWWRCVVDTGESLHYTYRMTLQGQQQQLRSHVINTWCSQHLPKGKWRDLGALWRKPHMPNTHEWAFKRRCDAVLFALTWG
jgi:hypothetical protein